MKEIGLKTTAGEWEEKRIQKYTIGYQDETSGEDPKKQRERNSWIVVKPPRTARRTHPADESVREKHGETQLQESKK